MERTTLQRFMYTNGKLFEKPTIDSDQWEEVHSYATIRDITFTKSELIKILKAFGDTYTK